MAARRSAADLAQIAARRLEPAPTPETAPPPGTGELELVSYSTRIDPATKQRLREAAVRTPGGHQAIARQAYTSWLDQHGM